ncbi:MAG: peptidase S1, partial [Ktedonobacteraceae bacterium]|nr:peptidase S1 [Ktedonobacteraceae bacterium]
MSNSDETPMRPDPYRHGYRGMPAGPGDSSVSPQGEAGTGVPPSPQTPQAFPGSDPAGPGVGGPPARARGNLGAGAILGLVLAAVLLFGAGLFGGWQLGKGNVATAPLQPGQATATSVATDEALQNAREAVVEKVRPAVVQINVVMQRGEGLGSGVIIDQRGYIVTNNHVVEGAQKMAVVLAIGTTVPAALAG